MLSSTHASFVKPPQSAYPFDPGYGYRLEQLLEVEPPGIPDGFLARWRMRYRRAVAQAPRPRLQDTGVSRDGWRVFDLYFDSTDSVTVGGWLLLPESGEIRRGMVISHGYGGRAEPDWHWPLADSALLFYCCRGLSRSPHPPVSNEPRWHVLHDIDKPQQYILGGCVEDTWLATSVLLRLFPHLEGHLGFVGSSFGGGIGAMMLAVESRISRAHLHVPSFGHQPLRMQLPTYGSADSVQRFARAHPELAAATLPWYDAAVSARFIEIPVLCACARYDPMVAPPGQFAIYNALQAEKQLYVLSAGHHDYPCRDAEEQQLRNDLEAFFAEL